MLLRRLTAFRKCDPILEPSEKRDVRRLHRRRAATHASLRQRSDARRCDAHRPLLSAEPQRETVTVGDSFSRCADDSFENPQSLLPRRAGHHAAALSRAAQVMMPQYPLSRWSSSSSLLSPMFSSSATRPFPPTRARTQQHRPHVSLSHPWPSPTTHNPSRRPLSQTHERVRHSKLPTVVSLAICIVDGANTWRRRFSPSSCVTAPHLTPSAAGLPSSSLSSSPASSSRLLFSSSSRRSRSRLTGRCARMQADDDNQIRRVSSSSPPTAADLSPSSATAHPRATLSRQEGSSRQAQRIDGPLQSTIHGSKRRQCVVSRDLVVGLRETDTPV